MTLSTLTLATGRFLTFRNGAAETSLLMSPGETTAECLERFRQESQLRVEREKRFQERIAQMETLNTETL
jgi:DNA-binding protein H-NS